MRDAARDASDAPLVDKAAWLRESVQHGKTFADIGGLWGTKNEMVSVALDAGAAEATMIDITALDHAMWSELDAHLAAKGDYQYRKLRADACSPDFPKVVGSYDVVHCSGILYHLPDPMALLTNLRAITNESGILTSMTVPALIANEAGTLDLRGGGALFAPGLDTGRRAVLQRHFAKLGIASLDSIVREDEPWRFPGGELSYVPWWWFLTPDTLRAMVTVSGFEILDAGMSWGAGAYSIQYRPRPLVTRDVTR